MMNVRSCLVVAALAVSSPALADTNDSTAEIEMATELADAVSAESNDVVFHNLIEFAPASARVYSADRELVTRMAKTWLHRGQAMITVHGYSESLDLDLAIRRANAVRRHLIKAGVSPSRVDVVGHTLDKQGRRIDLAIAAK